MKTDRCVVLHEIAAEKNIEFLELKKASQKTRFFTSMKKIKKRSLPLNFYIVSL